MRASRRQPRRSWPHHRAGSRSRARRSGARREINALLENLPKIDLGRVKGKIAGVRSREREGAINRVCMRCAAATGIVVDASDRFLVCGVTRSSDTSVTDASATIWRFHATGALDGTLPGSNGTGMTRIDPRSGNAGTIAGSLVLGASASAYVAGTAFDRSNGASDAITWKLKP